MKGKRGQIGFTFPPRERTSRASERRMLDLEKFASEDCNWDIVCTFGAITLWRRFGGQLWGYFCDDNPKALIGKTCGGHDFSIIDGRFLVDAWASKVEGYPIPVVFDLATARDRADVEVWYGDPARWELTRREDCRVMSNHLGRRETATP